MPPRLRPCWVGGLALCAALASGGYALAEPTPAIAVAPQAAPRPLTQGMPVFDKSGVRVGAIAAVADSASGAMVVLKVDGKLVSIPQASLTLDGNVARSAQTKAQIISAASAH
jgi:hypothetical protein